MPSPSAHPHLSCAGARFIAIALVATLTALAGPRPAGAQAPLYPPDFTVSAGAGSVMGEHPRRLVVIDSTGTSVYCYTAPADRDSAVCTTSAGFSLAVSDLNTIWSAVQSDHFFALSDSVSGVDADGTYAHLVITANGLTRAVSTQNHTHAPFDDIMRTINGVLPVAYRLKYNAIAP